MPFLRDARRRSELAFLHGGHALLGGALANETVDVTTCGAQKITRVYPGIESFAARPVVIGATGAVPAASPSPTLVVKITPATSTIGAL